MGLFDKVFDKNTQEDSMNTKVPLDSFSIKKTRDVPKLLKDISKLSGVSVKKIDFDIIHVTTEVKLPNSTSPAEIDDQIAMKLKSDNKNLLLDPRLEISQIYEINIKPYKPKKDLNLELKLIANKSLSRARAIVKKESIIKNHVNLFERLKKEFRKIKARRGMFIDIFEENMIKGLKKLVAKIEHDGKLKEDFVVELCKWLDPEPTVDDEMIKHFEIKRKKLLSKMNESQHVDYRERGFLVTVEPGELVLEYIKPRKGSSGRDCKGQYVEATEPKVLHAPEFVVDVQTIQEKDQGRNILYIAKTKGYVYLDKKELRIAKDLEIDGADFKSTGNIKTAMEKEVSIHLTSKESYEDNIGPNITLEAKEIKVDGSVANGAKLKAQIVEIKGQTHKSSEIFADNAKLNIHRGYLKAKNAHIFMLEGGTVEAESAEVSQATGGSIKAKFVEIANLMSNVTITASNKIEITALKGGDNKFIIEPAVTKDDEKKINKLMQDIKIQEKELKELQKKLASQKSTLQHAKESMASLKNLIMQAKKENRVPPKAHIDRYKKFTDVLEFAKEIQDEISLAQEKLNKDKIEIDMMQDATLYAKIVNHDSWKTHNKIFFKLIDPPKTIEYIPKIGDKPGILSLKQVSEEKFQVVWTDLND